MITAAQTQHILRYVQHAGLSQGCSPGGHDADPPVADAGPDVFGITAIQPVLIAQVRIAFSAPGIRSMAGRAISREQTCSGDQGLFISCQFFDARRSVTLEDRPERGLGCLHLALVLLFGGPVQDAAEPAQTRIEDQVDEPEYQRNDEQVEPPAGQGVVVLLQIIIPHMTSGVGIPGRFVPPVHVDEREHDQYPQQRGDYDEPVPKVAHEVRHHAAPGQSVRRPEVSGPPRRTEISASNSMPTLRSR